MRRKRWYRPIEGGFSGDRASWWIAAALVTLILLNGPATLGLAAPQDHLSIRAESVVVKASLRRDGERPRLELNLSAGMPCEVIARYDPATTTFIGKPDDSRFTVANGQVIVQSAAGSQVFVLDFSGAAPIQLQLRSGGRLLGEGRLSVSDP